MTVFFIKNQKAQVTTKLTYFVKSDNLIFNEIPQINLTEKEILQRISYVPQNIYLFPDSILNNISCFGQATEEKVYEVCKNLNIHNKILEECNIIINLDDYK